MRCCCHLFTFGTGRFDVALRWAQQVFTIVAWNFSSGPNNVTGSTSWHPTAKNFQTSA